MKRYASYVLIGLILIGIFVVYPYYNKIYSPNISIAGGEDYELFIRPGMDYTQVAERLRKDKVMVDTKSFHWVSERMNYPKHVYPGRYIVKDGMSNRELITRLRSGEQDPIDFTFVKFRLPEDLTSYAAEQFAFSKTELRRVIKDEEFLKPMGLTSETVLTIFLPNTYEMYWDTSAEKFVKRMYAEYKRFWNDKRNNQRRKWGLSRLELMTIASIVEEETQKNDEKAKVAGVYLNRIRKKWPLQADPTVKYAVGDFSLKRILNIHLETDSPYNTYKYPGIPPSPICTPSTTTIDAVLNGERHDYMFFCANYDMSGYHHFSKTVEEHNAYAKLYHQKLNELNIR